MNSSLKKGRSPSKETLNSLDREGHVAILSNNNTTSDQSVVTLDEETAWGLLGVRPRCLQWLNTSRWMIVVLSLLTILQGRTLHI
jgi:hypothetical protein